MPHATSSSSLLDEQDDALIQRFLGNDEVNPEDPLNLSRDLETGEKADDAVDYEDLSDNDLADDEDLQAIGNREAQQLGAAYESLGDSPDADGQHVEELSGPYADDFDDLFGDVPQSPTAEIHLPTTESRGSPPASLGVFEPQVKAGAENGPRGTQDDQNTVDWKQAESSQRTSLQALSTQTVSKAEQMQQYLISMSSQGIDNQEHVSDADIRGVQAQNLASLWPKFKRESIPRFMDLLPHKKAYYVGKKPAKLPKPVYPTKLNLDLALDQEKQFIMSSGPSRKWEADDERHAIVRIHPIKMSDNHSGEASPIPSDSDDEAVGGVTWQDMQIICEDWDCESWSGSSRAASNSSRDCPKHPSCNHEGRTCVDADAYEDLLLSRPLSLPSLRDPAYETARIARHVTLDLNDPRLLVEKAHARDAVHESTRNTKYKNGLSISHRYNISNDEAYDLLKENHQSKIRSNLGNPQVEHSLPAVRLQWPYYKTKLEKQEARSFHRPVMSFRRNEKIVFTRPRHVKRKHLKGRDTFSLFGNTHDLSMGDNSSMLLLEYSEEFPTIMSNFGMGSRIINYYRRRSPEDSSRPKLDIGETNLLMPQDKSPFSMFGHINPGEVSPALYNGMYKAPLFAQEPKSNDFLVVRNTTGVNGPSWYLRTIEHLRVVGQEFPSIDVPGPHSRKVTTAAKNRLKMISYRLLRRSKTHKIKVSAITKHFADSTDMQNRQKMKEFMQFDKTGKEWEMRSGEAIPDEESIRTMVKPEDVCLLESMQVGQQHLQDAGFGKGDDDAEGEAANQGRGIEQLLAPWFTTRNFLNAVQGKAMLELHGEGDPSGRGEAFSFIKTSMKGGFKAMGESVEDRLDAKKMKELGGHSYNVARQQRSYEESIRRIWDAQKLSLSSAQEHSEADKDDTGMDEIEDLQDEMQSPRSEIQTPVSLRRRDDDSMSQFSRFSTGSQAGKVLRITRRHIAADGSVDEAQETIRNPRVIRHYMKRRNAQQIAKIKLHEVKPTGDAGHDRLVSQALADEVARLERNKDRRLARDKQKGLRNGEAADSPGSPSSAGPPIKSAGTQRKCANCGQVGHIKTNKKLAFPLLCPMLNGTMKQDDGFGDSPFAMGAPVI
ncbi:MAG: hypothetical protein Q9220_007510 [cf. Caloplaca sp. 1 TL-2023]